MRIAVALPPIRDFYLTPHRMSALGARIVAHLCEQRGHEVKLFLFPQRHRSVTLPLPTEASHLRPYLIPQEFGPLSFFTRFQHFGPSFEECARQIAELAPHAVFISSFAYAYAEETVELARALRRTIPTACLVVGGAGPSACPEYYLMQTVTASFFEHTGYSNGRNPTTELPLFDFVIAGEGEVTVPLLLEMIERHKGSKGPSSEKHVNEKPQLLRADRLCREDELTAPIAILKETAEGIWATTCLSRGCPKGCRFCSNHLCHGQEFRTVRMDALGKALMNLPANKLLHLNFEDDNLLCVPDYFFEVLQRVKTLFPSASFSAENGLDYLLLDATTIGRLIQYGFRRFNLSLGTIYPETALRVDRPINLSHYREVIREIHTRGASSITYFIAGLEGDTPERIVQQIQFLQSLPTLIGISLFYPVPGIPDFSPPPELLRKHPGLGRGSFAYPWTGTLTTEELVTAFRLCRYVNLLKKEQKTQEEEVLIQRIQEKGHLLTFLKQPSNQQQLEGLEYRRSNNLIMGEVPINQTMVKLFFS